MIMQISGTRIEIPGGIESELTLLTALQMHEIRYKNTTIYVYKKDYPELRSGQQMEEGIKPRDQSGALHDQAVVAFGILCPAHTRLFSQCLHL